MIDGREKRKCQLAFELQTSRGYEKRSKGSFWYKKKPENASLIQTCSNMQYILSGAHQIWWAPDTVSYCFIVLALIKLFSVTERTQESLQKHSEKAKPEYQAFQTGLRER